MQFILVADCGNNRVVLLSPTLEFVRYVYKLSKWSLDANEPACRLHVGRFYMKKYRGHCAKLRVSAQWGVHFINRVDTAPHIRVTSPKSPVLGRE